VVAVACSPDGNLLAAEIEHEDSGVAAVSVHIRLFDLRTGKELPSLRPARPVGFSAGGDGFVTFADTRTLAARCAGRLLLLWDLTTRRETARHEVLLPQRAVSLPDGTGRFGGWMHSLAASFPAKVVAASTSTGLFTMRELSTGKELRRFRWPGIVHSCLAFSADGAVLALTHGRYFFGPTGKTSQALRLFDTATGRQFLHQDLSGEPRVCALLLLPDDKGLVMGMADSTIIIWDLRDADRQADIPLPAPEESELSLYHAVNPNMGTAAARGFRDKDERIVKAILYKPRQTPDGPAQPPFTEGNIEPFMIVLYRYDDQGREVRREEYTLEMELLRSKGTIYDAQGQHERTIWQGPTGTIQREAIHRGPRARSYLLYDATGEGLLAISGRLPDRLDLACGWGAAVNGLAGGVVPTKAAAPLRDMEFSLTVKNMDPAPAKVVRGLQFRTMALELRDAAGRVVPHSEERIAQRTQELRFKAGPEERTYPIKPGHADRFDSPYRLDDWYADLPPGAYTLTVRRRIAGPDFDLVCNTIALTIEAEP